MFRRLRQIFESIAYAGMKPSAPPAHGAEPSTGFRWLGPLGRLLERFVSGRANADPLYLSNRSLTKRIAMGVAVCVPCVIVLGLMVMALNNGLGKNPPPPPPPELTAGQLAAKALPDLSKVKVESNRDLQMVEVKVEHSEPPSVIGTVRNTTHREIRNVNVVVDLSSAEGSQLGGVSTKIAAIGAESNVQFRIPIEERRARVVLVRELRGE